MTKYTDTYPDAIEMLLVKTYSEEGPYSLTVPINMGITWLVATAEGCGGMGDSNGGGGAIAKSKILVTPGEVLSIQVGKTSTSSVLGDSYVKRANNSYIVYADRGRGNSNPGLASNSTGQVKRDGYSGGNSALNPLAGAPASDESDIKSAGLGGFGFLYSKQQLLQAADYGGGGKLYPRYDGNGDWTGDYTSDGAGSGFVRCEFYNGEPGLIT